MPRSTDKSNSNGRITPGQVGVGLAGAVVGATAGIAFADQKTRAKIVKLAKDANNALNRLMESLTAEVEKSVEQAEIPEKAERAKKEVKKAVKGAKNEISSRAGR